MAAYMQSMPGNSAFPCWRPAFLYPCHSAARGPVGDGAAVLRANCVALVWMSREPGCRLWCISIACSCYPGGVVCLTCGRFSYCIWVG
jgi:hypothetical protein